VGGSSSDLSSKREDTDVGDLKKAGEEDTIMFGPGKVDVVDLQQKEAFHDKKLAFER